ncbi:MAG: flagellar biosynthetic protein FliQ [Planctomycetota bacterium]|jgi:flagellar biosynthetic protein FliQ
MAEEAVDIARIALLQALIIAVPILGAGLVIGLIISLTLTFVPKIFTMILVAVVLMGWIALRMTEFAIEMFSGF